MTSRPHDPPPGALDDEFADAWALAQGVPGWLKAGQARMLFDAVVALPDGATVLEIGSHQGRSTVVLGRALRARSGTLVCVDPFVDGRLFGGSSTRAKFEQNVSDAGIADLVRPSRRSSAPACDRAGPGGSTCSTSTASTTTGRSPTTCAGRPSCPRAVGCWCTTRSPRSG